MAKTERCAESPFAKERLEQRAEVAIDKCTCAGDDSDCPVGCDGWCLPWWRPRRPRWRRAPTTSVGRPLRFFGRLVRVGWVSMLAGLEENQAELAHLNFVAVG